MRTELSIIMQHNLVDKKIIVTGASSGIGKQLAMEIAKQNGIPIMLARTAKKLKKLQQHIQTEMNVNAYVYPVDLFQSNNVVSVINQIFEDHKQIHGLINNAGVGIFDYIVETSQEDTERMFQLNVLTLIQLTRSLLPHLIKYNEGHIINIASQAGKISTPKSAVYAATKHAVIGFTNALRLEVATKNILVTTVNLGPVNTNFFATADPSGTYQKNVEKYMLDPGKVAKRIVDQFFIPKREINMPWWMEFGSRWYSLLPSLMETLFKKQFQKK